LTIRTKVPALIAILALSAKMLAMNPRERKAAFRTVAVAAALLAILGVAAGADRLAKTGASRRAYFTAPERNMPVNSASRKFALKRIFAPAVIAPFGEFEIQRG
jgi:hypothetical protein